MLDYGSSLGGGRRTRGQKLGKPGPRGVPPYLRGEPLPLRHRFPHPSLFLTFFHFSPLPFQAFILDSNFHCFGGPFPCLPFLSLRSFFDNYFGLICYLFVVIFKAWKPWKSCFRRGETLIFRKSTFSFPGPNFVDKASILGPINRFKNMKIR